MRRRKKWKRCCAINQRLNEHLLKDAEKNRRPTNEFLLCSFGLLSWFFVVERDFGKRRKERRLNWQAKLKRSKNRCTRFVYAQKRGNLIQTVYLKNCMKIKDDFCFWSFIFILHISLIFMHRKQWKCTLKYIRESKKYKMRNINRGKKLKSFHRCKLHFFKDMKNFFRDFMHAHKDFFLLLMMHLSVPVETGRTLELFHVWKRWEKHQRKVLGIAGGKRKF